MGGRIKDARARLQYANDIAAIPGELRAAVSRGRISLREAAAQAAAMRNQIMELARRRSSPVAHAYAYATRLKRERRSVAELSEKYAQRLYRRSFAALSEILREEVAPVFHGNLSPLAVPETEGWTREAVITDVQGHLERQRTGFWRAWQRLIMAITQPKVANDRWQRTKLLVP